MVKIQKGRAKRHISKTKKKKGNPRLTQKILVFKTWKVNSFGFYRQIWMIAAI